MENKNYSEKQIWNFQDSKLGFLIFLIITILIGANEVLDFLNNHKEFESNYFKEKKNTSLDTFHVEDLRNRDTTLSQLNGKIPISFKKRNISKKTPSRKNKNIERIEVSIQLNN